MQSFDLNRAMANFVTLERSARTYDAVMSAWRAYEAAFAPDVHYVRYEDVIDDFDATVGGVLDYLGLPWDEAVRDYAERARQRGRIRTPSYHRVAQPLYRRASGRWLKYREHLEAVLPVLEPWIEAWGYAAPAGATDSSSHS